MIEEGEMTKAKHERATQMFQCWRRERGRERERPLSFTLIHSHPLFHCSIFHSSNVSHSLAHALAHSHTRSRTHSLTHTLAHALTRSRTHSMTHSLTHSL